MSSVALKIILEQENRHSQRTKKNNTKIHKHKLC